MEKLNVLTVNYKSKEFIDNLIKKLNNENVDYELIVVNNSENLLMTLQMITCWL